MDSLTFTPGRAFLSSNSPAVPWTAVFEDEGPAGYFYACDRSRETHEESILDAVLIYSSATGGPNGATLEDGGGELETPGTAADNPARERLASIQWSRDGQQCVLYLDGNAQAFIDFAARLSFCRSNFPNFLDERSNAWRKSSHAWDDAALQRFEAAIYA
jgi:hypothetical protein